MRGHIFSSIGGGIVGGLLVLALQGSHATAENVNTPGIVEVKELNVLDSNGKTRINLRCDSNNQPRMRMFDERGSLRYAAGLSQSSGEGNPFLYQIDQSGNVKANLSVAEDGAPVFYLNGHDGKPRLFMCASPEADGDISQLIVYGDDKGERTQIISSGGQTGISSYKHGAMRTYSGIMPEGLAGLMANDATGKIGTVIGVTADDRRVMAKLRKGQSMSFGSESKTKSHK